MSDSKPGSRERPLHQSSLRPGTFFGGNTWKIVANDALHLIFCHRAHEHNLGCSKALDLTYEKNEAQDPMFMPQYSSKFPNRSAVLAWMEEQVANFDHYVCFEDGEVKYLDNAERWWTAGTVIAPEMFWRMRIALNGKPYWFEGQADLVYQRSDGRIVIWDYKLSDDPPSIGAIRFWPQDPMYRLAVLYGKWSSEARYIVGEHRIDWGEAEPEELDHGGQMPVFVYVHPPSFGTVYGFTVAPVHEKQGKDVQDCKAFIAALTERYLRFGETPDRKEALRNLLNPE